jgi:cyclase
MASYVACVLLSLAATGPSRTGRDVVSAMHDRYAGKWYRTLSFVQKNTATAPDGRIEHSTWREYARRLKRLGFDLATVHDDSWEGRPVYVVGARAGDLRTRQFWVDKERLVFVRRAAPRRTVRPHTMAQGEELTMRPALLFLALGALAAPLPAQQGLDTVQIRTVNVADGVYMLMGAGGNIGVSAGANGIMLIDDQFAPLSDKIRTALTAINPGPIRFLLNTHWHGDHTGGNENFAKGGVVIVAHENVRHRMSVEQFIAAFGSKVPPSPETALPIVTFTDAVTFYLNGDSISALHVAPAHTDGDVVIYFRRANVVHMGDTYFNGRYPFIDLSSGGSVDGMVAAVDRVLAMTDHSTKYIPGHGELSGRAELGAYRDMLATVRDRIRKLARQGRTLAQVKAAKPSAEFDAAWGTGFINPDRFIEILYTDLSKR